MNKLFFASLILLIFSHCSSFKPIDQNIETDTNPVETPNIRSSLIDYARDLIGSKYKYGGTTPNGFDCSGFTQYVYKFRDISLPHNAGAQAKLGKKIRTQQVRPGDLAFFKKGKHVNHVGMVTKIEGDDIYMIHSSSSRGIIEECLTSSTYWKPKLLYFRKYIDD